MNLVPQMIEGEHAVEKHQHTVGNVKVIHRVFPDVLQSSHDVIGAIAHRAGGEWRQALDRCRTILLQEFLDDFENAPRAALDFAAAFDPDLGATRLQPQKWPNAKKRIASDLLS